MCFYDLLHCPNTPCQGTLRTHREPVSQLATKHDLMPALFCLFLSGIGPRDV
jgi:hypothetical protein